MDRPQKESSVEIEGVFMVCYFMDHFYWAIYENENHFILSNRNN